MAGAWCILDRLGWITPATIAEPGHDSLFWVAEHDAGVGGWRL